MNQDIRPQDLIPRLNLTQASIDRTTKPESNANAFFKIGEMFATVHSGQQNLTKENERLRRVNAGLRGALTAQRCKCVKELGMLKEKCSRCVALDYRGE